MGTWGGVLMDLLGFMQGMVWGRGIWKEECYVGFARWRNYVCELHGSGERKRGR